MNDMLKEFGDLGAQMAAGPNTYTHPQAQIVLEECESLLSQIPEGQRLLAFSKNQQIKVHVISGKIPDFTVVGDDTVLLLCPLNTKAVDLEEMACNLGMAIRNVEQPHVGIPKPLMNNTPEQAHALRRHFLDITLEMCRIVSEIYDLNNKTKIVDLLEKLGHRELYEAYRSGKSEQEMADIYYKSVNAV
ncbi:MAG: hypothetical protein IAE63_08540 [Alphaproteobacteria bacterium]|nr:hypothetical protein [Alphaproteobacteria bacterium]